MAITMAQAVAAWQAGNDRGEGFAPYRTDFVNETIKAYEEDGWRLVLDWQSTSDVVVMCSVDGEMVAIGGDDVGRGAWAVDITGAQS
jgi:hypothetical protein